MATKESLEQTITIGGRRHYRIPDTEGNIRFLPSVTTIIDAMTDKSSLEAWKRRVGEAEANRISTFSANRGTCMHQMLEYWFESEKANDTERLDEMHRKMSSFVRENGYTDEEYGVGRSLFESLRICGIFERVKRIIESENTLYSFTKGGYAGRVDCVYENIVGDHVLLDFKTARHRKSRQMLDNYYLQLGAYYVAYWQMHHVKLHHGELWVAVENDAPQIVTVTSDELKESALRFLAMVEEFHKRYDNNQNK